MKGQMKRRKSQFQKGHTNYEKYKEIIQETNASRKPPPPSKWLRDEDDIPDTTEKEHMVKKLRNNPRKRVIADEFTQEDPDRLLSKKQKVWIPGQKEDESPKVIKKENLSEKDLELLEALEFGYEVIEVNTGKDENYDESVGYDVSVLRWASRALDKLYRLRDSGEHCDVFIQGNDGLTTVANSSLLSAASPVLRRQLRATPGMIHMETVSSVTWEQLITFIYTGEVTVLSSEEQVLLLEAASELQITGLIEAVRDHDNNDVNVDVKPNVADLNSSTRRFDGDWKRVVDDPRWTPRVKLTRLDTQPAGGDREERVAAAKSDIADPEASTVHVLPKSLSRLDASRNDDSDSDNDDNDAGADDGTDEGVPSSPPPAAATESPEPQQPASSQPAVDPVTSKTVAVLTIGPDGTPMLVLQPATNASPDPASPSPLTTTKPLTARQMLELQRGGVTAVSGRKHAKKPATQTPSVITTPYFKLHEVGEIGAMKADDASASSTVFRVEAPNLDRVTVKEVANALPAARLKQGHKCVVFIPKDPPQAIEVKAGIIEENNEVKRIRGLIKKTPEEVKVIESFIQLSQDSDTQVKVEKADEPSPEIDIETPQKPVKERAAEKGDNGIAKLATKETRNVEESVDKEDEKSQKARSSKESAPAGATMDDSLHDEDYDAEDAAMDDDDASDIELNPDDIEFEEIEKDTSKRSDEGEEETSIKDTEGIDLALNALYEKEVAKPSNLPKKVAIQPVLFSMDMYLAKFKKRLVDEIEKEPESFETLGDLEAGPGKTHSGHLVYRLKESDFLDLAQHEAKLAKFSTSPADILRAFTTYSDNTKASGRNVFLQKCEIAPKESGAVKFEVSTAAGEQGSAPGGDPAGAEEAGTAREIVLLLVKNRKPSQKQLFRCRACWAVLSGKKEALAHQNLPAGACQAERVPEGSPEPQLYQCSMCLEVFSHPDTLLSHYKSKDVAVECKQHYHDNTVRLHRIVSTLKQVPSYFCARCETFLRNFEKARVHAMKGDSCLNPAMQELEASASATTDSGKRHYCERCKKVFGSAHKYRVHLTTRPSCTLPAHAVANEGDWVTIEFPCQLCEHKALDRLPLRTHAKREHPAQVDEAMGAFAKHHVYKCMICQEVRRTPLYIEHLWKDHFLRSRPEATYYACKVCGYRTTQTQRIKQHFDSHEETKTHEFMCATCGKSYSQHKHLEMHERKHMTVKPYECGYCGRTFVTSGKLSDHLPAHSRLAPYRCTLCGKKSLALATANYHLAKVHQVPKGAFRQYREYTVYEQNTIQHMRLMCQMPDPNRSKGHRTRDVVSVEMVDGEALEVEEDEDLDQQINLALQKIYAEDEIAAGDDGGGGQELVLHEAAAAAGEQQEGAGVSGPTLVEVDAGGIEFAADSEQSGGFTVQLEELAGAGQVEGSDVVDQVYYVVQPDSQPDTVAKMIGTSVHQSRLLTPTPSKRVVVVNRAGPASVTVRDDATSQPQSTSVQPLPFAYKLEDPVAVAKASALVSTLNQQDQQDE